MSYANALNLLENPTGNRALSSGPAGLILEESQTTKTELEYLVGVTSPIQDQLNDTSITREGNTFNNANELVKLDGLGKIPSSAIPSVVQSDKAYFGILQSDSALNSIFAVGRYVSGSPDKIFEITDTASVQFFKPIQGNLIGNATSATTAGSATSFTGNLLGDVTGIQSSTVVSTVGAKTAVQISTSVNDTLAATNLNTISTIVKRDASGNFSAGTITASLSGNASTSTFAATAGQATNFTASLGGDVTGTQVATTVSFVNGQSAVSVSAATVLANAATSLNTAGAIVRRDPSGNFSANIITASLNGNAATATNAAQATLALSVATGSVTNNGLALMAANTVKANITVGNASPTDVALANFKGWLGNTSAGANPVGDFSISGNLAANVLSLSSGSSVPALNLTGSGNVLLTITSTGTIARSGATNAFLQGSADGDICIIQNDNVRSLLLGMASAVPNISIVAGRTDLTLPVTFPQTLAGAAVASAVKTLFEYDELYVHATALGGALAVASFNAAYVFRKNNIVTVILNPWGGVNATASATETFTTVLPARFRPALAQVQDTCSVTRNNLRLGLVRITSAGAVTFFGDETGGNFNNGQIAAFGGGKPITYSVT